jgi:hypothetical protein
MLLRTVLDALARGASAIAGSAPIVLAAGGICHAQSQPLCIPGTPLCASSDGHGGIRAQGGVQGQVGPNGASASSTGSMDGNGNANANASAGGTVEGQGQPTSSSYASRPTRFGSGVTFCGTFKAGVLSGYKGGPCFAVSFRTESLSFEMETQLLFGGTRHSIDWVFPMSFVIPLTSQRSLYEGLQLRVGGSPIGATFARARDGGTYVRFGLHAGLSYEWELGDAASWRVFDARAFLDFGTRREVDRLGNFLDFGGQLSTGLVL